MLEIHADFRSQLQVENLNPPEPCGETKGPNPIPVRVNFMLWLLCSHDDQGLIGSWSGIWRSIIKMLAPGKVSSLRCPMVKNKGRARGQDIGPIVLCKSIQKGG